MKKFLASLLVFCNITALAYAQVQVSSQVPGNLRFEKVPEINGAVDIVQDSLGFMWFAGGSDDGLYRFDGYEVKKYSSIPGDETSLSDNWVETLLVDRKGRLWVGTFSPGLGGLHLYDPSTETFTRFQHDPGNPNSLSDDRITVILEDREEYLWIGTFEDGLNRLDTKTETFTRYQHDPDDSTSLSGHRVRALYEDSEGTLWVGTSDSGLNRFDGETGIFTRYQNVPGDETSLSSNENVRAIFEDSRGNFWVGTGRDGLHTMDRETGTFTRYPYDPDRPDQLHMPQLQHGPFIMEPMTDNFKGLSFVYEDRHNKLWIGGFGGGIDVYDPHTGLRNHYEANLDDPSSRDLNLTWTIYESTDGTIWIGTWSGLFRAAPSLNGFSFYQPDPSNPDSLTSGNIWRLSESQDSLIYVPTRGGGLNVFDPKAHSFSAIQHDADDSTSLSADNVLYAIDDRSGTLWVGTAGGGLNRQFDREVHTFKRYRHDPDDSLSLSDVSAFPFEDSHGTIWVFSGVGGVGGEGGEGGLNRLVDPDVGTFQRYMHDPDDPFSLSSNSVRVCYEDSEGNLWIGTMSGLGLYDRDDDSFRRLLPGIHNELPRGKHRGIGAIPRRS